MAARDGPAPNEERGFFHFTRKALHLLCYICHMIKDICSQTIDFSKIERVGSISDDNDMWQTFKVYFTGGGMLMLNHNIRYSEQKNLPQIRREDFIKIWREV